MKKIIGLFLLLFLLIPCISGDTAQFNYGPSSRFFSYPIELIENQTGKGLILEMTIDSGQSETSFGQPYRIASDGELESADPNSPTTMPAIGIGLDSGTGSGKRVLVEGYARNDDWSFTSGGLVYVDTDPNNGASGLTQTAPSESGDQVQVIGFCIDPNKIWICPNMVTVEIE